MKHMSTLDCMKCMCANITCAITTFIQWDRKTVCYITKFLLVSLDAFPCKTDRMFMKNSVFILLLYHESGVLFVCYTEKHVVHVLWSGIISSPLLGLCVLWAATVVVHLLVVPLLAWGCCTPHLVWVTCVTGYWNEATPLLCFFLNLME